MDCLTGLLPHGGAMEVLVNGSSALLIHVEELDVIRPEGEVYGGRDGKHDLPLGPPASRQNNPESFGGTFPMGPTLKRLYPLRLRLQMLMEMGTITCKASTSTLKERKK